MISLPVFFLLNYIKVIRWAILFCGTLVCTLFYESMCIVMLNKNYEILCAVYYKSILFLNVIMQLFYLINFLSIKSSQKLLRRLVTPSVAQVLYKNKYNQRGLDSNVSGRYKSVKTFSRRGLRYCSMLFSNSCNSSLKNRDKFLLFFHMQQLPMVYFFLQPQENLFRKKDCFFL